MNKLLAKYGNLDWLTEVKRGNIPGHRLIHKFGKNDLVVTTPSVVAVGGFYRMPSANVSLEVLSGSADDADGGVGANSVRIEGLVESGGLFVSQTAVVVMNGLTAVPIPEQFIRVFRVKIETSGTYADAFDLSGRGTITIREVGGGDVWLQIAQFAAGMSAGQSQVAAYTTPSNTESVLYSPLFTIEANKDVDVFLFNRQSADDLVAPFSGIARMVQEWLGLQAPSGSQVLIPLAHFDGAVDIGFMAEVETGTARVSAEFWLLEIDK